MKLGHKLLFFDLVRISPYISEGSGLKQHESYKKTTRQRISPYISEGSGLKLPNGRKVGTLESISPYISEGSGLKPTKRLFFVNQSCHLPLHQ